MAELLPEVFLARHGETSWTISRQHTVRTEIALTARGEANAMSLGARLKGETFQRVVVFGHGHFFRVLAARWLGLPAGDARHFWLGTPALCTLGYEHTLEEPVILLWNDDRHAVP